MDKTRKIGETDHPDRDFGFLLWQLEEIENFYPCYKTMIGKENK